MTLPPDVRRDAERLFDELARRRLRRRMDAEREARGKCPRCGRKLITKRDGILRWKACPAPTSCGWTVFDGMHRAPQ